jgi:hypothetical protein
MEPHLGQIITVPFLPAPAEVKEFETYPICTGSKLYSWYNYNGKAEIYIDERV